MWLYNNSLPTQHGLKNYLPMKELSHTVLFMLIQFDFIWFMAKFEGKMEEYVASVF